MKSFLVRNKHPLIKWGMLNDGIMFKGVIPNDFDLAIVPGPEYIIIDVDRHGNKDGFDSIPNEILKELESSFNYKTKNNGKHYWLKYTGNVQLPNKGSGTGMDLRTEKGYVVFYPRDDFRKYEHKINKTSKELNSWIENTFYYVKKDK